jgi:hypothetical protein
VVCVLNIGTGLILVAPSQIASAFTWKHLLAELEEMGITRDMIENNRGFVRSYVQEAFGAKAVAEMDAAEMSGANKS